MRFSGKEPTWQCRRCGFSPWIWKISWRREWQSTLVFLPGISHWTEEPGRLQSIGSQRVRHDLMTKPPPILLRIPCVIFVTFPLLLSWFSFIFSVPHLTIQHSSPWVYPVWSSLSFLDVQFFIKVGTINSEQLFYLLSISSSGTPFMHMLVHESISQVPQALFIFLYSFFFLILILDQYNGLIFILTNSFFFLLKSAIELC